MFWGASLFLKQFLETNDTSKFNIIGILDVNSLKWGEVFCGYKIISPDVLKTYNDVSIIFTVKKSNISNYAKMLEYLDGYKLDDVRILPNPFQDTNFIYLIYPNGERKRVQDVSGLSINWLGDNSIIEIDANPLPTFKDCLVNCYDNSYLKIGSTPYRIKNTTFSVYSNSKIIVGKNISIGGGIISTNYSDRSLIVGDDCMFSYDILIRTSDSHTIYDVATKKVLNSNRDVKIGNHVWLCPSARVLKGAIISDNSIVATSSLVNKEYLQENIMLAGCPAKIVKTGVNWDRRPIAEFESANVL